MTTLQLTPAALSLLLLAAHFFRSGDLVLVLIVLATAAFLFVRRPWAVRVLQAVLIVGSLEWLRTTAALVSERRLEGLPYTRLMIIMGLVAAFTALSAALTTTFRVSQYYTHVEDDVTEDVTMRAHLR